MFLSLSRCCNLAQIAVGGRHPTKPCAYTHRPVNCIRLRSARRTTYLWTPPITNTRQRVRETEAYRKAKDSLHSYGLASPANRLRTVATIFHPALDDRGRQRDAFSNRSARSVASARSLQSSARSPIPARTLPAGGIVPRTPRRLSAAT